MAQTGSHEAVLAANVELSAQLASSYNESEPHYRPENVARVAAKLEGVIAETGAERMLDLGCGTGFMIDIARTRIDRIHGVDASPAMIGRVDTEAGPAEVTIEVGDTGDVDLEEGTYDVVTAYSFLHHLYEVGPTLRTAARALRPGGKLYVDLEPNRHFWDAIAALDRAAPHDPIIEREIAMVADHEGVALDVGVDAETFNLAEWGKTERGGLGEEEMTSALAEAGFASQRFFYEWFVGQGQLINDPERDRERALGDADVVSGLLARAHPLSRPLFKYMGFVATR
ncbi:MAG: class I SAM-dependent methyltransferase [Solirubrobacterales bacterium]|nr:class I SAM-dependent methyltransferase [Solirubrobacterales bacterium]